MPLKLNIGLARKVGEANYGSRGASVNVEMELDSTLVSEPGKLQERIRQLFNMVRCSLTEELNGNGHVQNGTGSSLAANQTQSSPPARPATASQVKAILAIARSQRLDLKLVLQNRFHAARPEDLSIKQASELIDTLKSSNGSNGG